MTVEAGKFVAPPALFEAGGKQKSENGKKMMYHLLSRLLNRLLNRQLLLRGLLSWLLRLRRLLSGELLRLLKKSRIDVSEANVKVLVGI